jgi:hypothetical protein
MSKIATYFGEKNYSGPIADIYAEHWKSRNIMSD